VLSTAAISSILSAVTATVVTMRLTENRGIGLLSPQAIGIVTAAVVMLGFRFLYPGQVENNVAFAGGTDAR
jgi:SSS family solute:Na+ symporter